MAKKKTTKGKRYSEAEKKQVLDFVAKIDAEKGRGGVAEAVRKYGITALTIAAWKKKAGGTYTSSKAAGSTAQSKTLHRLALILDEIESKKVDIIQLEKEYARLKKKI